MTDLYIGVYWHARPESVEECARRIISCHKGLAEVSDLFASWYRLGNSREEALQSPVDLTNVETVSNLLLKGMRRRDGGGTIIHELGFTIGLWNGLDQGDSLSLRISCGSYSRYLGNSIVLALPASFVSCEMKGPVEQAFATVVASWEPDWGGVVSRKSRELRSIQPGKPFADWMVFLKGCKIDPAMLPDSASITEMSRDQCIVITQDAPVDAMNSTHLRNVQAVEMALGLSGGTS